MPKIHYLHPKLNHDACGLAGDSLTVQLTTNINEVKQMELVKLQGSEKQIAWAKKIRKDKLAMIREVAEKDSSTSESVEQAIEWLSQKSNSKWWIENRKVITPALIAYANYKATNTLKIKLLSHQKYTVNGETVKEQKVLSSVSVIDCSKAKNPVEQINALKIQTTYNEDGTILYKLGAKDFDEDSDNSFIKPLNRFLPGGWASQDIDAIILRTFKTRDRIGGEDIEAYIVVKVKEFAKVG